MSVSPGAMRMAGGTSRPSNVNASWPLGSRVAVNVIDARPSCDRTTGASGKGTTRLPHDTQTSATAISIERLIDFLQQLHSHGGQARCRNRSRKDEWPCVDRHTSATTREYLHAPPDERTAATCVSRQTNHCASNDIR